MLTQTGCEFFVIMSAKTPAMPGPDRLLYLTEVDNDKTSAKFEITHPFDEKVKKFTSRDEAKMYLNALRKKEFFTTPLIPEDELQNCEVFKVTCGVDMCKRPSERNATKKEPLKFKKIECRYIDRDGSSKKMEIYADLFVPWSFNGTVGNPLCKPKRLIYLGSIYKWNGTSITNSSRTAEILSNSIEVDESEYLRLLDIYREFKVNPGKYILEEEQPTVPYKKVKVLYTDRDGTAKSGMLTVSQFVPWILHEFNDPNCERAYPSNWKYMIFIGNDLRYNEDTSIPRLVSNSIIVSEKEYNRLYKIYKKFYKHPTQFLKKGVK